MSTPPDTTAQPGAGAAPDGGTGVIHDIGYRHHSGERLGRSYIRRSLFAESAKGAYGLGRAPRSKVMPMLLLVIMTLPALVIVIITAVTGEPQLVATYTSYLVNMQVVLAIFVAAQAPAIVSRDLRFGVMSLYFSRPMERVDYVVAKFAAMTAAILVLLVLPLTLMLLGALVAKLPLGEQVPDYLRALAGAVIVSLVLAGISLVIAAVTPRRGLGVAAIITVLIVLSAVYGVTQELALSEGAQTVATYLGLMTPVTLADGIQSWLGAESALAARPPDGVQGAAFLLVALAIIGGCYAALRLRYRKVSVS